MLLNLKRYGNIVNVSMWRNTQVWLKGSVLKTDRSGNRRRGSNPFSSANIIYISRDRAVWLARWAHNPKVEGSNPSPATIMVSWWSGLTRLPVKQKIAGSIPVETAIWLCSSVGRAEDWKSLCRWFDSNRSHQIDTN